MPYRKASHFFSVVINEDALEAKVKEHGTSVIESTNGLLLKKSREKVLSYVSSFYNDQKDIRLTVYESLANFAANKELTGWVRENTVIDTLPRFDEIKKLSEENGSLRSKVTESLASRKVEG